MSSIRKTDPAAFGTTFLLCVSTILFKTRQTRSLTMSARSVHDAFAYLDEIHELTLVLKGMMDYCTVLNITRSGGVVGQTGDERVPQAGGWSGRAVVDMVVWLCCGGCWVLTRW